MKSAILIALGLVGTLCLGWYFGQRSAANAATHSVLAASAQTRDALGMREMLRIDPKAGGMDKPGGRAAVRPVSAALQAYRDRHEYESLLAQLKAGEQNGESLWLQAKIIGECAKRPKDESLPRNFKMPTAEEQRAKFMAKLIADDPQRERRIAAYDLISNKRCGTVADLTRTHEEIYDLFKVAAATGDPHARAEMIWQDRYKAIREARKNGQTFPFFDVSDDELHQMKDLLATQDPEVVNIVSEQLGGWMDGGALVLNNSKAPVNSTAFSYAWAMVGCDLGADCGRNSRTMLAACAFSGECDVDNLVDYTYFYGASLYHVQLIDQYRNTLLTMIRSGDFSPLRIVRSPAGASPVSLPPVVPKS